jgi:flagellin-like hook-associated protein FlgL
MEIFMPKTRIETTQAVINKLNVAENGVDAAFSQVAEFNALLPKARQQAHVALEVGQEALEHAGDALQHILRARASMVAAHKALATVKTDMGLDTVAFGGLGGKPEKSSLTSYLSSVKAA